jgi:hypothetical protein
MLDNRGLRTDMQLIDLIHLAVKMARIRTMTCPARGCGRWLTVKHIGDRRVGTWMGDCWYCSSDCFRKAAEKRFSELLSAGVIKADHVTRMPIGLLLIRRGLVSNTLLQQAAVEHKETGADVGDLLVRYGSLSEKQLTSVRAAQWGCPIFSVPKGPVMSEIKIPQALVESHSMIPLHYVAATNRLLMGFVQGIEYGPLYAIEQMTGCKTQPCFVTPEDFRIQMEQRAQVSSDYPVLTELVFKDVERPAELARILADYGLHFKANEVKIDICREHLWARLKSGPRAIDLLFRIA